MMEGYVAKLNWLKHWTTSPCTKSPGHQYTLLLSEKVDTIIFCSPKMWRLKTSVVSKCWCYKILWWKSRYHKLYHAKRVSYEFLYCQKVNTTKFCNEKGTLQIFVVWKCRHYKFCSAKSWREVLAVPPIFLQESSHSGGIPVDSGGMKLAEGSANLFIPVFSIPLDPRIYTRMFPRMVFPRIWWNRLFVCYLFVINNKQCLVVTTLLTTTINTHDDRPWPPT